VIATVPKIDFLPEDDARAIVPPTEEQYQELIRGAEQLQPLGFSWPWPRATGPR